MRTTYIFTVLMLVAASGAFAQVYKWVDKDGKVHYSDQPHKDAKPADLKPLTTVEPIPVSKEDDSKADEGDKPFTGYRVFKFERPAPGETLTNIGTLLQVTLDIQPDLQEGHQVSVTYDGQRYLAGGSTVTLTNVFRGEHTLSAEVADPSGRVLSTTGPVTFYVQQNSVLQKLIPNPNPKK